MLNPSLHILRERAALPKRTDNLLKLWIHRILVKLGGASCLGGFLGFEDSRFADYLNLRSCIDDKGEVEHGGCQREAGSPTPGNSKAARSSWDCRLLSRATLG